MIKGAPMTATGSLTDVDKTIETPLRSIQI